MEFNNISWWNIDLGEKEINNISDAIKNRNISQGKLTEEFENELARILGVKYVVCTTSGTVSLLLAYMATGIGPGDEIIIPNRTFIATANPAMILGAKCRLVDARSDSPIIDEGLIENFINSKTKAIVPVHLNGCSANMEVIMKIANKHNLTIIEDTAQGLMSKRNNKYLGTFGRFGCFSLGMAKLITTGQGGFVVCKDKKDAQKIRRIKNQGANDVRGDMTFDILSGNFKFTDIQSAIGIAQISRIPQRLKNQVAIYNLYKEGLASIKFLKLMPVDIESGEIPLRAGCLCSERERFMADMLKQNIQVVPQITGLNESPHLEAEGEYKNSIIYSKSLVILPSGPDQSLDNVRCVIDTIHKMQSRYKSL